MWGLKNSKIENNLFYNIADGGHLLAASNTTFVHNYGTHIHRMGQEIQEGGGKTLGAYSNLKFDGNVFYDWINPYNDSEGLSVCPDYTTNVIVTNNYIRHNIAAGSGWGPKDPNVNRFGYGIESICPGMVASNNTIILSEPSAEAIAAGETCNANNNIVYGGSNALWGIFASDIGPTGKESTVTQGAGSLANTVSGSLIGAPNPPANTFAGPQFLSSVTPPSNGVPSVPPASQPASQLAKPFSLTPSPGATSITFTFPATADPGVLHTFTPADDCGTVTIPAGATTATIGNLNNGWTYIDTLTAGSLTASTSAQTLGTSPDGTKATIAALIPTSPAATATTLPPLAPSVSEIDLVTHYADGSSKTVVLVSSTGGN